MAHEERQMLETVEFELADMRWRLSEGVLYCELCGERTATASVNSSLSPQLAVGSIAMMVNSLLAVPPCRCCSA